MYFNLFRACPVKNYQIIVRASDLEPYLDEYFPAEKYERFSYRSRAGCVPDGTQQNDTQ